MKLGKALASAVIAATLGACAAQLDESGAPADPAELSPPGGKGGASGNAGSGAVGGTGFSGAGKGGSGGGTAGSGGGTAGSGGGAAGGRAGAAAAGSAGSGGSGGDDGPGSAGSGASGAAATGCTGLPLWTANAEPPNKPMVQGDELAYMGHKFAVEPEGAMISWWNDVCPPAGDRETWCETDAQRYADLGPCE